MGREIFAQLYKVVHREDIQMGNNYLYLCDMSGTGKSHLLAALVCQLVFEGKRVFYVPVCRRLVDDVLLIQGALVSAPYNMSECSLFSASLLLQYFVDLWPGAIWSCLDYLVNKLVPDHKLVPNHTLALQMENQVSRYVTLVWYLSRAYYLQ